MFVLFHAARKGEKGQIAGIVTMMLIAFLITAFIAVNIGKVNIQRTRIANAATAAALAAGSTACVMLNIIANLNDVMLATFYSFCIQVTEQLVFWLIDFVTLIVWVVKAIFDSSEWGQHVILAVNNLALSCAAVALQVIGASRSGQAMEKMIRDDFNAKLPKRTRNAARSFGFMNAGVDEPRVSFAKSGAGDYNSYLANFESGFEIFMRTMPSRNFGDTNYGTSTLSHSWQERRTTKVVGNTVSLTVTPLAPLSLRTITFGNVANDSGLRRTLINIIDSTPGIDRGIVTKPLLKFAINISPAILVMLQVIKVMLNILRVLLAVLAIVCAVLAVVSIFSFNWYNAARYAALAIALGVSAAAIWPITTQLNQNPPDRIPCFLIENGTPALSIPVTLNRTTNPSSLDYGIWSMNYPGVSGSSVATIDRTYGAIFPVKPGFDFSVP